MNIDFVKCAKCGLTLEFVTYQANGVAAVTILATPCPLCTGVVEDYYDDEDDDYEEEDDDWDDDDDDWDTDYEDDDEEEEA